MANVAQTQVIIKAIDQFSNPVNGMALSIDKFNAGMSTMAKIGASIGASVAAFASIDNAISGIGNLVSSGVKLNIMMENAAVGMSGVLLNMTKVKDRQLEWNEAMAVSQSIIKDLNKQAMITAATPSELIGTFSGLLGIGLGRGLNIQELQKFTVMGVNAVKSIGLDGRQLIQELRDLLQGSISAQKSSLATALGLSGKDIKEAQASADGLFKFLYERMKGFETSAKYFPETFKGSFEVLKGALEMALAEASKPAMDAVKQINQELFNNIYDSNPNSSNWGSFKTDFIQPLKEIGEGVGNAVKALERTAKMMKPVAETAVGFTKGFIDAILGNMNTVIAGFVAMKTFSMAFNNELGSAEGRFARIANIATQIGRINPAKNGEQELVTNGYLPLATPNTMKYSANAKDFSVDSGLMNVVNSSIKETETFQKQTKALQKAHAEYEKVVGNISDSVKSRFTYSSRMEQINAIGSMLSSENELVAIKTKTKLAKGLASDYEATAAIIDNVQERISQKIAENHTKFDRYTEVSGFSDKLQKAGYGYETAMKEAMSAYVGNNGDLAKTGEEIQKLVNNAGKVNELNKKLDDLDLNLRKSGISAANSRKIISGLMQQYQDDAEGLKKAINTLNQSTNFDRYAEKTRLWSNRIAGVSLGVGTLASLMGDKLNSSALKTLGNITTQAGIAAIALGQMADVLRVIPVLLLKISAHPIIALATALTAVGVYAYTSMKESEDLLNEISKYNAEVTKFNEEQAKAGSEYRKQLIDIAKYQEQVVSQRTGEARDGERKLNIDALKSAYALVRAENEKANGKIKEGIELENARKKAVDDEAKKLDKIVRKWEDVGVIQKDILAKIAETKYSPMESDLAKMEKDIAHLTDRINTAAIALKQMGVPQEQIDNKVGEIKSQIDLFRELKTEKIKEAYDIEIHWDTVMQKIGETTYNNTQTFMNGFNELTSEFTSFGQNIITEGANFFERFDTMFKNFANSIVNTMLKIYLQGILTKTIMSSLGLFGGGSNVISLSGSMASGGMFSVGGTSVFGKLFGFANGGVANGWSIVGEQGAELVNFSNPGRVYTASETAKAIGGGGATNVKVEIINQSGIPMEATQNGTPQFDGVDTIVCGILLNAYATNKMGVRDILGGQR